MVSVTFENSFVVTGIKVMEGTKGLFVSMPSRKTPDGEYKDIAYPITKEFRQTLNDAILTAYNGQTQNQQGFEPSEDNDEMPF